jgi:deoxyribonuclease-4
MDEKNKLLFGPAGTPLSAPSRSTEAGILQVKKLKLDCMEVEFVQGVRMGPETAVKVREAKEKTGIRLTVHGPYYINLYSRDPKIIEASRKRILDAARVGNAIGAESVTFHAAFYLGDPPEKVYEAVKKELITIVEILQAEKNPIWIRPETTGKPTQFGSLDELLSLSKEIEQVMPCIDFSHLHARTNGKWNTPSEFEEILGKVESALGSQALSRMHMHLSGIAYGEKGEKHHLTLKESDFQYKALLEAFKKHNVGGFLISESPIIEKDAQLLKRTYARL